MLDKLEGCFERLQTLEIKPTITNLEKLLRTLYDLREVYAEIEKGGYDGRTADSDE